MTQRFKENDALEALIIATGLPLFEELGLERDNFYEDAYESYGLGEVLYDLNRDPLADVIERDLYAASYPAIHNLFTRPGTFEFYLEVFRKIFPADVDVQFTVPSPGVLLISVQAISLENFDLLVREIVDDAYVYSNLVTSDTNDQILAQGTKGIKTQADMDALKFEISVCGIYTVITLET